MIHLQTRTHLCRAAAFFLLCLGALHLHLIYTSAGTKSNEKPKQMLNSKDPFKKLTSSRERILREHVHVSKSQSGHHAMGWTPSQFPDPRTEPNECNIADVVRSQGESTELAKQPRLLFCDPDNVFTPAKIIKIADALRAFTAKYAQDIDTNYTGSSPNNNSTGNNHQPNEDQDKEKEALITHDISGGKSLLSETFRMDTPRLQPEIAIAVAQEMDYSDILHDFAFYTFEDEDDMINDAAMYFASFLHSRWFRQRDSTSYDADSNSTESRDVSTNDAAREANGILIFVSVADRICYIYPGGGIAAVLPWWRLDQVVSGIREDLRNRDFFDAIIGAIADVSMMLDEGPPTTAEKAEDFFGRFGIFLLFSTATFFLALGGEYRDRRIRYEIVERVSEMDDVETQKARQMQQSFQTLSCPICLEPFGQMKEGEGASEIENESESQSMMKRVDSFGIPLTGSDGEKLKILRCGHAFDASCWTCWIASGSCADPGLCPVCRVDIAKPRKDSSTESNDDVQRRSEIAPPPSSNAYGTFSDLTSAGADDDDFIMVNSGWLIPT